MTSRFARTVWILFGAFAVLFMLSPLVLLVLFSFGENSLASFPMRGLTLDWYRRLFANDDFRVALKNSAVISLSVGAVSVIVGNLAAFAIARLRRKQAGPLLAIATLPLMMPPLVLAVALLTAFVSVEMTLSLHTVVLSHLLFTQPFVILVVYARMTGFDWRVVDSARDLGASPFRVFREVIFPLSLPGVLIGAIFVFVLCMGEFATVQIIGGNQVQSVGTVVRQYYINVDFPAAAAGATILVLAMMVGVMILLRFARLREATT